MFRLSHALFLLAVAAALMGTPAEAVQRAFVASYGSDANVATLCGLANPCRSFATAVTVVDPNGEVLALDSIGYGVVTLTQSISLVAAPGAYAGISVSSGNGVTIATAGISVTLRGLTINGIGGNRGVSMTDGAKLSIENCVISNFSGGYGVYVATAATVRIVDSLIRDGYDGVYLQSGATATISGSKILGHIDAGVYVIGNTAGTTTTAAISDTIVTNNGNFGLYAFAVSTTAVARMSVTRSTLSNNFSGANVLAIAGTAVITVSNSMVTGNGTGLSQSGLGSTLRSLGNNTVDQNGANATGTITTVSSM